MPKKYVFGYGSIINPASMAKDVNPKRFRRWSILKGYERIFDAVVDDALALNLRENATKEVEGILIEVDDTAFESINRREKGYAPVDVTAQTTEEMDGTVFVFIAPHEHRPELKIPKDYWELCTSAIPPQIRQEWIDATVIDNPIE